MLPMNMKDGPLSVINSAKEWEWKIENFSFGKENYKSPEFTFEGESWWLDLFPVSAKGCIFVNSYGTIGSTNTCMFLDLCRKSHSPPIELEFSVALKTTKGMKKFERRERFDFFIGKSYSCIAQWISDSEFRYQQTEVLSSGCITIRITMKRINFAESKSASTAAASSFCKDSLRKDEISIDRNFLDKRVKCVKCDEVVSLKNWFGHECQISNAKATTSISGSCVVCEHNKILQDLKQLLLNQEQTDIILRVKGEEFPAHKAILAARSSVFASTFRHQMKENKTGIVDIEDCDPSVFPNFLRFLYSNDTSNLSGENVLGLFTVADKYDCQDLRAKCVHFIKENLTVETFCKALALALLHNEAELLHVATDFFIENADKILVTVEWKTFSAENITYCNELFIKYVNSAKRSES